MGLLEELLGQLLKMTLLRDRKNQKRTCKKCSFRISCQNERTRYRQRRCDQTFIRGDSHEYISRMQEPKPQLRKEQGA